MKIVIIGGGALAVKCLQYLAERREEIVLIIITKSDKAQANWQPLLKEEVNKLGLNTIEPANLTDVVEDIKKLKPDVIFSIHCDMIIPESIIEIPQKGVINFHFALLPKHRGMYPNVWAILSGDKEAGVTLHYVEKGIDTGDIIAQKAVGIGKDTTSRELYDKTINAAMELFKETYDNIKEDNLSPVKQDESQSTYHDKKSIDFTQLAIDWNTNAERLDLKIRALSFEPYQHTYFMHNKRKIEVVKTQIEETEGKPGVVAAINDEGMLIGALNGSIRIKKLKTEGKLLSCREIATLQITAGEKLQ